MQPRQTSQHVVYIRCRPIALDSPSSPGSVTRRSLRVALDPVLRILFKLLAILPILVGNRWFDGVIWVWLDEECLNEAEDRDNLVRWFPFVGTKQTQAHGALVVVAHIGVVDLGAEGHDRGFEGILVGECDLELEVTALRIVSSAWLHTAGERVMHFYIPHTRTGQGRP